MRYVLLFIIVVSLSANKDITIQVDGMHCPLCTTAVKNALKSVDGVLSAKAILQDKKAYVTTRDDVSDERLLEAIKTTSYTGVIVSNVQK